MLINTLVMVRSFVGVLVSPSWSSMFPPTVNQIRCFSSLCVQQDATTLPYVTFLWCGTALRVRNLIVFVPFVILVPTPFANHHNSFEKESSQSFFCLVRVLNV